MKKKAARSKARSADEKSDERLLSDPRFAHVKRGG